MNFTPLSYKKRIIDEKIEHYLDIFPALNIEGPKWCGKTWTATAHSKTVISFDDEDTRQRAELAIDSIFAENKPQLIDEWSRVPKVWDAIRHQCDQLGTKGNFIITCSTKLTDEAWNAKIFHSGAGRIASVSMYPMSLYESGDSTGMISLKDLKDGIFKNAPVEKASLTKLAYLIVRGGWPANIDSSIEDAYLQPAKYIENILSHDINSDKARNRTKMRSLLQSLARNTTSLASISTLVKDISDNTEEIEEVKSRITVDDYLDVLSRLFVIKDLPAFSVNYRSSSKLSKKNVRHFIDPSLACAALEIKPQMLENDFSTFGLMFESLVIRDLRVYMDAIDGKVSYFRDNVSGDEVDAILEFNDGEYAAVEIKLGDNAIPDAIKSLEKYNKNAEKKPKFMMVIVGMGNLTYRDPETGIYIVPIAALKN